MLTNVTYVGKIKYKDEVHNGEHEAIVPDELFQPAQTLLQRNGHTGGRSVRNKHGALLRGLLRCGPCGCAMSHTYTSKGNRRYRYYVCGTAQQRGWSECPSPSVPAGEIERFVVEQIKCIGRDPAVITETFRQVREQTEEGIERLNHERLALQQQLRDDIANQSELAEFGHITTARMTQIMVLLNLAPAIQEQILFLPRTEHGRDVVKETDVRPIAATLDWRKQRRMWAALQRDIENANASSR